MTRPADANFTLPEFLAWARTKPAGEAYDFCDSDMCAVAQFGASTGRTHLVGLLSSELRALDPDLEGAVLDTGRPGIIADWTFGALVTRLEALLPETVINETNWTKLPAYMEDIGSVAADHERESAQ
jgi:hypothetical protein